MHLRWLALCIAVSLSGCFRGSYAVTRVVDGKAVVGPFVGEEAYAAYLEASILEAEGKTREALVAYQKALALDPKSPDSWARVGALQCKLGESPAAAFERAIGLDSKYEGVWAAKAECHLSREEYDLALEEARKAVEVEPYSMSSVILLARALERVGKVEEARVFLDELTIREPLSIEAHRARLDLALSMGDDAHAEIRAHRIAEIAPDLSNALSEKIASLSTLARIDEALLRRDLESAREMAIAARISKSTLALRAIALGRLDLAREEADLAMSANPDDLDAKVAKAILAQLQNDSAALEQALSNWPADAAPLSPLGWRLLNEMVARRLGDSALQSPMPLR